MLSQQVCIEARECRVLRMREGDQLEVCDGAGSIVQAVLGPISGTRSASVTASADVSQAKASAFISLH